MPNKTITIGKDGAVSIAREALPSEKEQRKKVTKATDFLETPKAKSSRKAK